MQPTVRVDTREFERTMAQYRVVSRKTMGEVIARQARELGFYLYGAFRKIAPSRERISSEAKGRGYRFAQPLSPKAYEFARSLMGSEKVIWGKVVEFGGSLLLRTVRIGKRGKRVYGGRRGRGGIAAGYAQGKTMARPDEHPINFQALASFFEEMLRRRGVKSLAVAWLPAIKKRVSATEAAAGIQVRYQITKPKASIQWTSSVDIDTRKETASAKLASDVPGLTRFPGIISRGVENARQNMLSYIDRKLREALFGASK